MNTSKMQKQFMNAIFKNDKEACEHIKESTIPAADRIEIYKNSTYALLIESIEYIYPVLHQLVGEDFFKAIATNFITNNPPNNCDITKYAWGMVEFLKELEQIKNYPYFIDIATLESNRQKAYYAESKPALNPEFLQEISEKQAESLVLKLQPHVFIQKSDFKSYSIWLAHHENKDVSEIGDINSIEYVLTYRKDFNIFTIQVTHAEFVFLKALQQKELFTQAVKQGVDTTSDFDAQKIIIFLLQNKLITKI